MLNTTLKKLILCQYILVFVSYMWEREKVDIFDRSDKMMKNKWKSGYIKNTDNGLSWEYFALYYWQNFFKWEK